MWLLITTVLPINTDTDEALRQFKEKILWLM